MACGGFPLPLIAVLGTCATFSATGPLARTEKGGARRGKAKVKNNGIGGSGAKKMALIRTIFESNFA